MSRPGRLLLLVLSLLAFAPACSDETSRSPTMPSPAAGPLSGGWSGMLPPGVGGPATLEMSIADVPSASGSLLSGTWNVRSTGPEVVPRSGTLSGTLIGGVADVSLAPVPRVECAPVLLPYAVLAGGFTFRVTGSGERLTGSVESWSCTRVISGPIELVR